MSDPFKVILRMYMAGGNFFRIGQVLALNLTGYSEPLHDYSIAVHTGSPITFGMGCIARVGKGEADLGIMSPSTLVRMAREGKGDFKEACPVTALAVFPHDDVLAFAVTPRLQIQSLEQVRDERIPLRLDVAPPGHPARVVVDQLLAEYGFSLQDIENWGGRVTWQNRVHMIYGGRIAQMKAGELDAVLDEAFVGWGPGIGRECGARFLRFDSAVLERLERQYGLRQWKIGKGRAPGIEEDIPSVDFRGWLLFCRENLDADLAYLIVKTIDEKKHQFEKEIQPTLPEPFVIRMNEMCQNTEIPLHPGADRYYRERGYLS